MALEIGEHDARRTIQYFIMVECVGYQDELASPRISSSSKLSDSRVISDMELGDYWSAFGPGSYLVHEGSK